MFFSECFLLQHSLCLGCLLCVQLFSLGFVLVLFQFLPCFFLVLALPHFVFLRVWARINQLFKNLIFPHCWSIQCWSPAAFRSTVSSGSLGKGRSCQYFIIKLGSFNGRSKPVEHFLERAGVQIGFFFIVTGTGPKTIVAGFFC